MATNSSSETKPLVEQQAGAGAPQAEAQTLPQHEANNVSAKTEAQSAQTQPTGAGGQQQPQVVQQQQTSTTDTASTADKPSPPKTPTQVVQESETQLKQAQDAIQKKQLKLDGLKKDAALLEADHKELKASAQGLAQLVDEYKKAQPGLQSRLDDLQAYAQDQRTMLDGLLSDQDCSRVREARSRTQDDISDLAKQVDERNAPYQPQPHPQGKPLPVQAALLHLQWKQHELSQRQAKYDQWKNKKAGLEAALKACEDLKKPLEAAVDARNYTLAYYYLLELEDKLGEAQVHQPQAFETALEQAWTNLATAKEAKRCAEVSHAQTKAQAEADSKALAEAKKNREQTILDQLKPAQPSVP